MVQGDAVLLPGQQFDALSGRADEYGTNGALPVAQKAAVGNGTSIIWGGGGSTACGARPQPAAGPVSGRRRTGSVRTLLPTKLA